MVLARAENAQWRYLLLRVYRYWDFPKGEVEAGEDDWTAAQRELHEDTGIAAAQLTFPWGHRYFDTEPYGRGKIARYFLACSHDAAVQLQPNPTHGRVEHHAFRWLSYPDALTLLVPRLQRILTHAHAQVARTPATPALRA